MTDNLIPMDVGKGCRWWLTATEYTEIRKRSKRINRARLRREREANRNAPPKPKPLPLFAGKEINP